MPRIRTVKPEFFKHEELFLAESKYKLPLRIAFVGLWCVADREGRFKWKPNVLKLDVLPFDNCDFSRVLDALATCGFIHKYEINSEYFGLIPKFPIHQVINNRESASVLPEPSDFLRVGDASSTPLLLAQGERKGKEGERKELLRVKFETFWKLYDKKTDRSKCETKFISLSDSEIDLIFERVKTYVDNTPNVQYRKNPLTWLNGKCWNDEISISKPDVKRMVI